MRSPRHPTLSVDLPCIPATTLTKDGQTVDTGAEVWTFRASADGGTLLTINWRSIGDHEAPYTLTRRAQHLYQLFLARKLQFSKCRTVANDFQSLKGFLRWFARNRNFEPRSEIEWTMLDLDTFRSYLEHGLRGPHRGNDFARLRDFYSWAAFVGGYPDFDRQLALSIKEIRAPGNIKGAAVRFHHPVKGPFDPAEQRAIIDAIRRGCGSPEDRAVVMIHLELGPNPNAVARLRARELQRFEIKTVERGFSRTLLRYQVELPRVKKRTDFRETQLRPVSKELGQLLDSLKRNDPESFLFHWLSTRHPEGSIRTAMRRFSKSAGLRSSRNGEPLVIHPRRFRSTIGTEMAREGASPEKIAAVLDHTDLQNVNVYVEASSYVIDQIGKRFDSVFEPVARMFRGKVVDKLNTTLANVIPSASAHLQLLNVGGIGMCGRDARTDGLCKLAPPLTCYSCEFFAAFRDGPHKEVLQSLEKVRVDLAESADRRIPMQIDEAISAARQLVKQIGGDCHNEDA